MKPFVFMAKGAMKRNGPQAAPTANGPEHKSTCKGGSIMSVDRQYGDSTPEINTNWKSIATLARAVVEKTADKAGKKADGK